MINNTNCPNCSKELPSIEKLFFCPFCAMPIKCKNCGESLLFQANACINCGTHVSQGAKGNAMDQTMNEFDFEQKGDSKKFKSRFSNEVGSVFAEALGMMLGGAQYKKIQNPFINQPKNGKLPAIPVKVSNVETDDAIIIDDDDYNEVLMRYFKLEDGKLKLINSRLKHSGKLDQAIRLAILTLFAYERAGQAEIEKSLLTDMLSSAKLFDTHFQGWLSKSDEIVRDGTKLQLSVPGKEIAEQIVKELIDDSISKGSIAFSKTGKSLGRRRKKNTSATNGESDISLISSTTSRKKQGPIFYMDSLIKEGFFSEKRKLNDIIEFLKVNKAETYAPNELSTPLKRMIKSNKLKREKGIDGQYEYYA